MGQSSLKGLWKFRRYTRRISDGPVEETDSVNKWTDKTITEVLKNTLWCGSLSFSVAVKKNEKVIIKIKSFKIKIRVDMLIMVLFSTNTDMFQKK